MANNYALFHMKYFHRGTIDKNGNLIFDYPSIFYKTKMELKEKRFKMVIEEDVDRKTVDQCQFYVGIIILKYCVSDIQFGGHEKDDIIEYFLERIFGHDKEFHILGQSKIKRVYPSLSSLNKKEMSELIDMTIMLLSTEFGIEVDDPDRYKHSHR